MSKHLCPLCLHRRGFTLDLRPGQDGARRTIPDGTMTLGACDDCGNPGSVWPVEDEAAGVSE